jgi:ApaG protein
MVSQISEGIAISVETYFEAGYSNVSQQEFMFAYRITIQNKNAFPVKLISRHWHIFEGNGTKREVVGDGVVGEQPTILPEKSYQYLSGCNLKSELGSMFGSYLFENLHTKKNFSVAIPYFEMVVPYKLN